jgi:hypothetical protein
MTKPMTKRLRLLTFVLTLFLTSCGQNTTETQNKERQQIGYSDDSSVVAILTFDTTQDWIFKEGKPTDLTNEDLRKIDIILNKCINDYNLEQDSQFKEINDKHSEYKLDKKNFTINLMRYKRQFVAILNSKGEKVVWVNCFCWAGSQDWKKNLIFVRDGGNCFFNLKINLTTGQYFELMVNGDA